MSGFQYFLLIIFCLTVPKTFVGKRFCVSEKNRISKKLTENKETLTFSVDNFCLTVPKIFVGEDLCVSEKIWYRKILCITTAYQWFQLKNFWLTALKKFVGEPSVFQINSGIETFFAYEREINNFRWKSFVSQCRKTLYMVRFVSKNFWHRKILRIKKQGTSLLSIEKLMSHSIEKHRRGNLLRFRKKVVSKHFMHKWVRGGRYSRFQSKVFTLPKNSLKNPSVF